MTEQTRVLVTGASGFVGSALVNALAHKGLTVTAAVRRPASEGKTVPINNADCEEIAGLEVSSASKLTASAAKSMAIGELSGSTDWTKALAGQKVVVHCAARAHVMRETRVDSAALYREVNVNATLNLARQAAAAGVRRFVFISSIKVNGEYTEPGQPFTAQDSPLPRDSYAVSKWQAEQGLQVLAKETGLELVIIRPPLIYGAGVKGNFATMVKLLRKGWPLPLGRVNNQRSIVALPNLVDLICTCIHHPNAVGQTFLVKDGSDLSTTELLRQLGHAMGRPARLLPVAPRLLQLGAVVFGKRSLATRLLGSLQVDDQFTRDCLGWQPPFTTEQGLRQCFQSPQSTA